MMHNATFISLALLSLSFGAFLSWLLVNTLKEGKEALNELREKIK